MKKIFIILISLIFIPISFSQVVYNPKIDSIKNVISFSNIRKFNRELSGDTMTNVNGIPVLIYSRYYSSPSNIIASNYIFEKFQSFGLQTRYQVHDTANINVIARKTGSRYPNQKVIISAHYDNTLAWGPYPYDTVHGSDDNASGVGVILEAARLIANFDCLYTVEFIAFDQEEVGLLGSQAYSDSCYFNGDSIFAVINLDMIGYDDNNDGKVYIVTNNKSVQIYNIIVDAITKYQLPLLPIKTYVLGSDHYYFWHRGYRAISVMEYEYNLNPYYHELEDTWDKINPVYYYNISKAAIVSLLSILSDNYIMFIHNPTLSGTDTSARNVLCNIKFPKIATGNNSPRLYYKIGNGNFIYVNPYSINGESYTFHIPGQPTGTILYYYFAAQDSSGNNVATYPLGGNGVNPPGTVPPSDLFSYSIHSMMTFSSTTTPKPIFDLQLIGDTINIQQPGNVENVKANLNINHPEVGELLISLYHNSTSSHFTNFNEVLGSNLINTTFSDSAVLFLNQGSPPFTGTFRPVTPLSQFINKQLQGNWILKIYDKTQGNTGTLQNWSLIIRYSNQVGIKKSITEVPDLFSLEQNFPNPFNNSTNIKYSLPFSANVNLVVYDITGRNVATLVNEFQQKGYYIVNFNQTNLSSGLYLYKLKANNYTLTKKMILIK